MKGSNFPAATGEYKVEINKKAPWQQYNIARLQISVGKPRYEGSKFFALIEWCKHRFDHVDLIVSDTLQRHNYRWQLGCDPASAWKLSRRDGELWMERNRETIDHLFSYGIIMWDDLISPEGFRPHETSSDLEIALDKTIGEFWRRQDADENLYPAFYMHSKSFLLEELGVFRDLFQEPAIDIYAGRWFEELMAVLFPEKDYLAVDFVRNKAFQG